jgi:hypothetical protein
MAVEFRVHNTKLAIEMTPPPFKGRGLPLDFVRRDGWMLAGRQAS